MTASAALEPYAHPSGLSMGLPVGWERLDDAADPVVVLAIEPTLPADAGVAFRANLVVSRDDLPEGLDLDGWQAGTEQLLGRSLTEYQVLDLERVEVEGRPMIRRLAHHRSPDGHSVTLEQWTTLGRGGPTGPWDGWTLTCSVATGAYDAMADALVDLAHAWQPPLQPPTGAPG